MKHITKIALCLVLALLFAVQPVFAESGNEMATTTQLLSNNTILEAVKPLIEAEAQFYNIQKVAVENVVTIPNDDGTAATLCDIVFTMTLKATSVEELPYVAGMLNELGVETAEECYAMAENTTVSAMSELDSVSIVANLVAIEASSEIESYAENIGKENTLNFSVLITTDSNGNVIDVLGRGETDTNGDPITFPLSEYFPDTVQTMYQNGADAASAMEAQAQTNDSINAPAENLYDRIAARDYAMTWSSEASYSSTCPHGNHYIDLSKYNPAYSYYCHQDCANFVSQAMRAGGVPTDSEWYPYSRAWRGTIAMYNHMRYTKGYWSESTYAACNAGGIIMNGEAGSYYGDWGHVNMCVLNDTVNHAYAAHNNDHNYKAYTENYWSTVTEFFKVYVFENLSVT